MKTTIAGILSIAATSVCVVAPLMIGGCASSSPEDVASSNSALSPSPNDRAAYQFFINKGLTSFQAAGIVGNLDQESQVDPQAVQGGGPGRGIAQWSVGGRWDSDTNDNAAWYARSRGESVWSLNLQLEFIWYELQTFPGYGLSNLRASRNVVDATIAFQNRFEACGQCDSSVRIADAQAALRAYGGSGGTGPCAHVSSGNNGTYCGVSRQAGFTGGDPTTLFTCTNGSTSSATCGGGCVVAPAGQADHCGGGTINPCAGVSLANNGAYCGASRQAGFKGGDANELYACRDGQSTASHCAKGCTIAPAGQDDHCT